MRTLLYLTMQKTKLGCSTVPELRKHVSKCQIIFVGKTWLLRILQVLLVTPTLARHFKTRVVQCLSASKLLRGARRKYYVESVGAVCGRILLLHGADLGRKYEGETLNNVVCKTWDTVEISGYARGRSGVCSDVESTATSPFSPTYHCMGMTLARHFKTRVVQCLSASKEYMNSMWRLYMCSIWSAPCTQ